MLRKLMLAAAGLAMIGMLSGCYTQIHKVGTGAAGANVTAKQQWFILWGLVPLTQVDSNAMAAGAQNYEVRTEHTAIDVIISIFTGFVTIAPRTVTVTK
jgi:hypothetical protein